ncbi:hypothetical protein HYH03_001531 [Edaphochlamys debaryana]|uniref:Methyltransferase type 11 domain-containing protein n=1 Tax=Edaphochlamys debaryana TaxID=47281 RepID=A0A836C6C4_9CHLO|nr:hypothetical protein HYH03_001531 [Edaphochlamys debaryana]|eukprot:KAG2500769.1 hypothetical protein HYH03_001531 [Edaphochlamys debaryana]
MTSPLPPTPDLRPLLRGARASGPLSRSLPLLPSHARLLRPRGAGPAIPATAAAASTAAKASAAAAAAAAPSVSAPRAPPNSTSGNNSKGRTDKPGSHRRGYVDVAALDARRFRLHESVAFWAAYGLPRGPLDDPPRGLKPENLFPYSPEGLAPLADPLAASYYAYHTARLVFFLTQALAGLAAHQLAEAASGGRGLLGAAVEARSGSAGGREHLPVASPPPRQGGAGSGGGWAQGGEGGRAAGGPLLGEGGLLEEIATPVAEALAVFSQDLDNIRAGAYPLPWDMTTPFPNNRQFDPFFVLSRSAAFLADSVATLGRRVRGRPQDVWLQGGGLYPRYYTKTFHYQTDGWLSDRSAAVYEHSTETLFFGRQDAMQRTSLLPISAFVAEARRQRGAGAERRMRLLEDAFPELPSVVSDLSPFYLAATRDNLKHWARSRRGGGTGGRRADLGGVDGTGCSFLQTPAEAIAAPNESFDIVTCTYLFHELPAPARAAAAREFARVLRPGGLCVLTDSVQLGDRPAWDETLGLFGDFNEPFYRGYIAADLGALFASAGLEPDTKYVCSATKTLAFRKPLASRQHPPAAAATTAATTAGASAGLAPRQGPAATDRAKAVRVTAPEAEAAGAAAAMEEVAAAVAAAEATAEVAEAALGCGAAVEGQAPVLAPGAEAEAAGAAAAMQQVEEVVAEAQAAAAGVEAALGFDGKRESGPEEAEGRAGRGA